MSYGELTLPPVWTGINKQTGRFLKGHVPANKGKKWSEEDETMITDLSFRGVLCQVKQDCRKGC
jgi:hypothetical protein